MLDINKTYVSIVIVNICIVFSASGFICCSVIRISCLVVAVAFSLC